MPLVRLSGEAFRRHARVFRPRRGLQNVKKVEADRLLDLHGAALCSVFPDILDPHIAPAPKIVHVLLLSGEQLPEALAHYAIQCPFSTAAELFGGSRLRGVIDHVFGELDWTAGLRLDCEGDLAEVSGVDNLAGVRARALQRIVSRTCQGEAALFGRMAQHDAPVFGIAGSRMEHPARKGSRQSRITPVVAGAGFIRRHLRRDHDKGLRIEECHTIGDGGHVPVGERDQTSRCDRHLFAGGSLPKDLAVERPGLHVEPPVVF